MTGEIRDGFQPSLPHLAAGCLPPEMDDEGAACMAHTPPHAPGPLVTFAHCGPAGATPHSPSVSPLLPVPVGPGAKVWALPPTPCIECQMEMVHECPEDGNDEVKQLAAEEYSRRNPGQPEISYVVITKEDVIEAIEKIPIGSAPGPDGVVPCLLKKAKRSVANMLADIYQQSIETGEIPQILKMGLISPIHKGDSASDPANFRPISLTSHLSKTEERIVRKTLVAFLEVNDKMDPNQHGSRQGRSTLSQLLEHHDEIVDILEKGENVDCIYTDFSKAFHKCDLGILMHKLKALGITGRLARWIHSFLSRRKQKIVVDGITSKDTDVTSGVPEGTVLGPLLFLIYISDIGQNISSSKKVYVDDTKLIKAVTDEKDCEDLQEELDILYKWADENNMQFNGKKFQVVRYGKDENLKNETLYFTENTENIARGKT